MSHITYAERTSWSLKVKLDGKIVGTIQEGVENNARTYQYIPKGQKTGGDKYPTLAACKASLEAPCADDAALPVDSTQPEPASAVDSMV